MTYLVSMMEKQQRLANIPALKSIHELPRSFKTSAHLLGLLAHNTQGFLQKPALVLDGRWACRGHCDGLGALRPIPIETECRER